MYFVGDAFLNCLCLTEQTLWSSSQVHHETKGGNDFEGCQEKMFGCKWQLIIPDPLGQYV